MKYEYIRFENEIFNKSIEVNAILRNFLSVDSVFYSAMYLRQGTTEIFFYRRKNNTIMVQSDCGYILSVKTENISIPAFIEKEGILIYNCDSVIYENH